MHSFGKTWRSRVSSILKIVELQELNRGERDTDNLSPSPGVAAPGERMDHDEFMRRTLELTPIEEHRTGPA